MQRIRDASAIAFVSIAFFVVGLAAAHFLEIDIPIVKFQVQPAVDLLLLGLAVMVFSMLFFGKLTPLFFFLVGANQAVLLKTTPIGLLFNALPLFFAGFTGTLFGILLLDDLEGTDNLYAHKNELLKWFAASVIIALAVGFLSPQISEINQAILSVLGK